MSVNTRMVECGSCACTFHLCGIIVSAFRTPIGLAVGGATFALVNASWIILVTDGAGVRRSARNHLTGTIGKVTTGPANAEVVLKLDNGNEVVAIVTNDSVGSLGQAVGQRQCRVQGVQRHRRCQVINGRSDPAFLISLYTW